VRAQVEKRKPGKPSKLSVEDQMLMIGVLARVSHVLHIGQSWEHITACRIVTKVKPLISGKFQIPGKKQLLDNAAAKLAVIDATETPIERPKKGQKRLWEEETTHSKRNY